MKNKRVRISPKDVYRKLPKLSDCKTSSRHPFFSLFIYATGQTVLVSAPSVDVAIYTLGSWLHSVGLDSRVMFKERFEVNDVLCHNLLYSRSCENRSDESLF